MPHTFGMFIGRNRDYHKSATNLNAASLQR
jgi:hypothetical protein